MIISINAEKALIKLTRIYDLKKNSLESGHTGNMPQNKKKGRI